MRGPMILNTGGSGAKHAAGDACRATDMPTRKRAAPPPPVAGDDDDALRQQVQQLLVAAEWGGPSVAYQYSLINSNINLPDCYSEYVEFWPRRSRRGAPDSAAVARR